MKRKLLTAVAASVAGLLLAGDASAYCYVSGKLTRMYCWGTNDSSTDYCYYYIAPETSNAYTSYAYQGYVYGNRDALTNALTAGYAEGSTVYCRGSSSSCPTSGTNRYINQLDYCYVYKNR